MVAREVIVRGPVWDHLFEPLMRGDWDAFPREQLFEGPAGSAKSFPIGLFLDTLCRQFAKIRVLVVRKTRVSLTQSWLKTTFEPHVLRPNDPIMSGASAAHRDSYVYPNGSEIVLGGMDNPTRLYSTEYDVIYCNEATEFSQEEVEQLHRALRHGVLPFQCMILDCNPDSEFHWLNQRCNEGPTVRRVTRLWHNPAFYGPDGWSKRGSEYYDGMVLTMTAPTVRARLVEGRWCTAEGAIIPFDKALHVLNGRVQFAPYKRPTLIVEGWEKPVEVRFFYGDFDHGFRNPGAFQVWAVDDERRAYLVREWYHAGKDEDWWAERILEADKDYMLHRVVCDSASPEKISKFNKVIREARDRAGREVVAVCIPAGKSQKAGKSWLEVQAALMRRMFERAPDGRPRAYVFADSLQIPDSALKGKPKRWMEEAAGWTFAVYDAAKHQGQPKEVGDPNKPNHAIDASSYGFEWLWGHDLPDTAEDRWGQVPPPKGSWAEYDLVSQRMREAEQRKKAALWH
jgi:PBSX family phage terminase large subunit